MDRARGENTMEAKHAEALSAFFDGERVDAELLAESLAQPGATALLAEFAAMRAQVEHDGCRPTAGFFQRTADSLRQRTDRRSWRRRFGRFALAASLALVVGMAGFTLGVWHDEQLAGPQAVSPPAAARLVATPPTAGAAVPTPSTSRPPRVAGGPPAASLRLRFGQWRPASGTVDAESGRR